MTEGIFMVPTAPAGNWTDLSENEKVWIEFIRVISGGTDPKLTSTRLQALKDLIDAG
ncbi:hypothetical protein [Thioclava sp. F42-5]|uniref:hypothetical protein n=1 Tax=Thioclava sp. F42-5 TaxID=1973005 RepID=UPI00143DD098|nr:hypothetical protein [Thioclava sp. F42-5]